MAELDILEYPDPRLRLHAEAVTEFGDDLGRLVDDMLETMYAHGSIGLSAPQVNDLRQVLVMDLSGNACAPEVFVNPVVLSRSAWGIVEESCLSVPGVVGNVFRATEVQVKAQDRNGELIQCSLDNMNAVCLQHEMDHLVGKLFIDRLSLFRRLRIRALTKAKVRRQGGSSRGRAQPDPGTA